MIWSAFYTNKLILTSLILSFINIDHALTEKRLNDELIVTSRLAGMADIASSVLHNVGNVITSANASIQLIYNKIASSKVSNLTELSQLFQAHQDDIKTFLTSDPRGERVPSYLISLSKYWSDDKKYITDELSSLMLNIDHIKGVINNQNKLGMSLGIMQEVNGAEVVEDALRLNQLICEQSQVKIIRNFLPTKKINIDRVKFLQILVNLIKNAIESLIESKNTTKHLRLDIKERNDSFLEVVVEDNGIGISPENLKQIFHQGFTSKKMGHGFGLHSSILAAQEMNGTLEVISDGVGKGALFTLRLPFNNNFQLVLVP
jgi:signal transduction histidine kinase